MSNINGKAWLSMAKEWSVVYFDCSTRHNALIDVLNLDK